MRRAVDLRLIVMPAAIALALVEGVGPLVLLAALAGPLVLRPRAGTARA